nr:MAG TPA: hypothetical protein [Caudoviricetes sp.]
MAGKPDHPSVTPSHQQEKFSYSIFLVRAKNKKSSGAQRPNKPPLQRPYTGWRYDGLLPSET